MEWMLFHIIGARRLRGPFEIVVQLRARGRSPFNRNTVLCYATLYHCYTIPNYIML